MGGGGGLGRLELAQQALHLRLLRCEGGPQGLDDSGILRAGFRGSFSNSCGSHSHSSGVRAGGRASLGREPGSQGWAAVHERMRQRDK